MYKFIQSKANFLFVFNYLLYLLDDKTYKSFLPYLSPFENFPSFIWIWYKIELFWGREPNWSVPTTLACEKAYVAFSWEKIIVGGPGTLGGATPWLVVLDAVRKAGWTNHVEQANKQRFSISFRFQVPQW